MESSTLSTTFYASGDVSFNKDIYVAGEIFTYSTDTGYVKLTGGSGGSGGSSVWIVPDNPGKIIYNESYTSGTTN